MMIFLGLMTAAGGLFLFLWYRTVVSLPVHQQPAFVRPTLFKWGVPAVSLVMFLAGIYALIGVSSGVAAATLMVSAALAFLVIKFDRYSADMRLIHYHFLGVRRANPGMEETEALYHTARWRYPEWSHDRVVELVAGKNIQNLILLMIIRENNVNPIQDWELYRSLKAKAEHIIGT